MARILPENASGAVWSAQEPFLRWRRRVGVAGTVAGHELDAYFRALGARAGGRAGAWHCGPAALREVGGRLCAAGGRCRALSLSCV